MSVPSSPMDAGIADAERRATAQQPEDAADRPAWLQRRGAAGLPTVTVPREWRLPGVDDLFRSIYTRAGAGFAAEVLAICSAVAGEGRTSIAVGLAITIAQDFPERRVLVVETDPQRPALAEDFGVDASPGLVDSIVMDEPVQNIYRPTYLNNLFLTPVGGGAETHGRPLRSSRMATIVDTMRENFDLVVLDLPPILANSDAVLLSDLADGAIVVVRAGVTPVSVVSKAVEQLDESKLRGVILNASASAVPGWLRRLFGI